MFYEAMDNYFFPYEIDMILDVAITLCPAMKRQGKKMYPANAKRAVPDICFDDEHAFMVAELLNEMVNLC